MSELPINLEDLLRQRTVEGDRIEYKAGGIRTLSSGHSALSLMTSRIWGEVTSSSGRIAMMKGNLSFRLREFHPTKLTRFRENCSSIAD